ncbi:MAG: TM1812 family CRISPR-associated protein [Campylobacteraceae bacterium]|jgi:CRISPR-associated DxTHG motif protein|nr:TM1812 family CRISPR-associated protein [Campylobacteraceae bacterium]
MEIVTIVGMLGGQKAHYKFDKQLSKNFKLKKHDYKNILPLLIDNFSNDCEIIPIFTNQAKDAQIKVLKDEFGKDYSFIFNEKYFIKNETDYYGILSLINKVIAEDDEYIIDLSHGFRHIPILATISLIAHNINSSNIEHILYAKEITQRKEYEIIDLKEYLELANMSYMLASFADNYTISKITFTDPTFQALSDSLSNLSDDILSNSIKDIFEKLKITIDNIDSIKCNEKISAFSHSLTKVREHIEELQAIGKYQENSRKLYEFSKLLGKRGYLLNAITLLFEAIGCYCMESLKEAAIAIKEYIEIHKNHYEQAKVSRDIIITKKIKIAKNSKLEIIKIREAAQKEINNLFKYTNIQDFKNFIKEAKDLKNNLSHGNHEESVTDAKNIFILLAEDYKKFCIDANILKVKNR